MAFTAKSIVKSLTATVVAIFVMTSLSSCSQFTLVNSEVYNNADLASYKTFRIVTPDNDNKLAPGMAMVTYYNIAAAIREEMTMRGYTETANSPLLINIGLTVHKEIETEPIYQAIPPMGPYPYWGPYYHGFSPWFMYPRGYYWPVYYNPNAQVITGIYREGVLTMDFVNMEQHLPLYSASVATILDGSGQFRNLKSIAEAVQTLFSRFPVAVLPQYKNK